MNPYDDLDVQLTLVAGKDDLDTRHFTLTSASTMSVGRSSKTKIKDLVAARTNCNINNPVISREHASFSTEYKESTKTTQLLVRDNGSMHGTMVNDAYIPKEETCPVYNGDTIQFGTTVYRGEETFEAPKYRVSTILSTRPQQVSSTETTMPPQATTHLQKSGFSVPDCNSSQASSESIYDEYSDDEHDDDDDQDVTSNSDDSMRFIPLDSKKQARLGSPEIIEAPGGSLEQPIEIDDVDAVPESVKQSIYISDVDDLDEVRSDGNDPESFANACTPSVARQTQEPAEYHPSFTPFLNDDSDVGSDIGCSSPLIGAAGSFEAGPLANDPVVTSSKTLPASKNYSMPKLFLDPSLEAPVPTRKLKIGDMLNDKQENIPKFTPFQNLNFDDLTGVIPPPSVIGSNGQLNPCMPQPPKALANPWIPKQSGMALPRPNVESPSFLPPPPKLPDNLLKGFKGDNMKPIEPAMFRHISASKKRNFETFLLDNDAEPAEAPPKPRYSPIFGPHGKSKLSKEETPANAEAVVPQKQSEPTSEPPRKRSRLRTVASTAATLAVGAAVGGAGTLLALVALPEHWF